MFIPRAANLPALLLIFTSFASVPLFTQAQTNVPSPKLPQADQPKTVNEKENDYSQEAVIIEQIRLACRFEKDGTGQRDLIIRVKIQSEAGLERFGQLVFPYSAANEKLEINYVRVKKSDNVVIPFSDSDVQDLSAPIAREAPIYTDLRQKHVTVRGLRPGDVLEYHLTWRTHTALAPNHFWFEHDFIDPDSLIVFADELELNIPSAAKVKLKTAEGFEPAIKEQDDRKIYSWKRANLKRPQKDEKEDPSKAEEPPEPQPRQVQMTTFQSWDEVGQWYAALERDRIVPDDRIRAKTDELVRGLKSDKEKIEALYRYVAQTFRYVSLSLGQGRYQPHAAAEVLANQYGDCKDKHTLLAAMLSAAGLRAFPALMNANRKIDPDVPSPGQFDHVISAIPLEQETFWVDTTAEVAPFRLLSPRLRNKSALIVPNNRPAQLATTPAEPPFVSAELVEVSGQVSELGKLAAHSKLVLRGDSEMQFRLMFRRTPKSEWKQLGYYLALVSGVRGEVTGIKSSEPSESEKPFELEYDLSSDDFLNWSSTKSKLSLPLPHFNLNAVNPKKQTTKPIDLGLPIEVIYRLKLTIPSKYQVRLPVSLNVNRDYATYSSNYKLEGNVLIAERKLNLRQREIPAERLQDYSAFIAAARSDEAQTLSLETNAAGTPAIPDDVKVDELLQAADAAATNSNFALAEELLRRVLVKEPKHKEARRDLGWALFQRNKLDEAIKVLNEQTVINPFDDYAYNLLGQVYWQQEKYSEAEAAFRKQIEVSPLDEEAHGNLGRMLVERRRYKEAVPELEKAISLDEEDETLQVSLGSALLNLNETTKALEAFDRAVKLAPGPSVWNDVAYAMSLKKVQLDRAQQYAESAVTAMATDLRNVELANLTAENLGDIYHIAAYWDTLGWVHFQKGNIDLAEKYVLASWSLAHASEVGYHLGQILEQRGKREEAIQAYALAVVADRMVPEARESLDRLTGKVGVEELLKKAQVEFSRIRTVKLGPTPKTLKASTEAQFFVVMTPGASQNAQVTDIKFIRGDESLRALETMLKGGSYGLVFPDDKATKVVRRGTLHCQTNGDCSFIMISPDFVTID
jgi:tetratricopeptide (TPR) repeat protein